MRTSRFHTVAGDLSVNDQTIDGVGDFWHRLDLRPSASTEPPTFQISFESCIEPLQEIEQVPSKMSWERSRPLWGDVNRDELRMTDGRSIARLQYQNRRAHFYLHSETLGDIEFFHRTFLLLPFLELLRTRDQIYLHGALVAKGERAILFLGSGGAGKSTIAAALMARGWRLISDDGLLLDAATGQIAAVESEMGLSAEALAQSSLDLHGEGKRGKIRIPFRQIAPERRLASSKPTDIVLLTTEGTPGTISATPRSRLLAQVLRDNPLLWAYPPLAARGLSALEHLLRQSRAWVYRPSRGTALDLQRIATELDPLTTPVKTGIFGADGHLRPT